MIEWLRSLFRRKPAKPMLRDWVPVRGRITRYGYEHDETPDSLTAAGWGAFGNRLRTSSLAISRDIEEKFRIVGIRPMDRVELRVDLGHNYLWLEKTWDDRTARSYQGKMLTGRFDIYCPENQDRTLDGRAVVAFRKSA